MKNILRITFSAAGLVGISFLSQPASAQTSQSTTISGAGNNTPLTEPANAPFRLAFSAEYSAVAASSVS
ncbi:MAG TPA: hypothetical protein VGN61_07400, partial [Verrucomicrobiae bacterium]